MSQTIPQKVREVQTALYAKAKFTLRKRTRPKRTSLKIHIDLVRHGEAQDVIKILKLWRHRHDIPLGSLVIELATGLALFNNRQTSLEDRVWKVLGWMRDSFAAARLVDPANSNNIVSDDISSSDRAIIVAAAMC